MRVFLTLLLFVFSTVAHAQQRNHDFLREADGSRITTSASAASRVSLAFEPGSAADGSGTLTLQSLADAQIWTMPVTSESLAKIRTLAVTPGDYTLQVEVPHRKRLWRQFRVADSLDLGTLVMTAKPTIRCEVVDGVSGKAVADARIEYASDGRAVTTNGQGAFELEMGPDRPELLNIHKPGFGIVTVAVPSGAGDVRLARIELRVGATVHLEIERGGERGPLDVTAVVPDAYEDPHVVVRKRLVAGASKVTLDDLATGTYDIVVTGAQPLQHISARVSLAGGDVRTVSIAIKPSVLRAHVAVGERPLGGAVLSLKPGDKSWIGEVTADPHGELDIPIWQQGGYEVRVRNIALRAPYLTRSEIRGGAVIDWWLRIPDRVVRGRFVDEEGRPVPDVAVLLKTSAVDGSPIVKTKTAADGTFEFSGVRVGPQRLHIIAEGYLDPANVTFDLAESDRKHETNVVLHPGYPRTIDVVDAHGTPLIDALIVCGVGNHVQSRVHTDLQGRGVIATPGGEPSVLYVFPREGSLAVRRLSAAADDGSGGLLRVQMPVADSTLRLGMVDTAGAPIAEVSLLMRFDGEMIPPEVLRVAGQLLQLQTDEQGQLTVENLPHGTYEFWLYASDEEAESLMDSAGQLAPITIALAGGEKRTTLRFQKRHG